MQLRPYQSEALDSIKAAFRRGNKKVMVCSPTGSGKGVMLASVINSAAAKGSKVLFLVHRTEILFQVSDYMDHYAIPHGVIKAGEIYDPRHNVDLASVQTMIRRIAHKDFGDYDMIVIDECFPAGTLVGGRRIESISAGDIVPSFNEKTRQIESKEVVRLFKNPAKDLLTVTLETGEKVTCTHNHPFYVASAWKPAILLESGDMVHRIIQRGNDGADHNAMSGMRVDRGQAKKNDDRVPPQGAGLLLHRMCKGFLLAGIFRSNGPNEQHTRVRANDETQPYEKNGCCGTNENHQKGKRDAECYSHQSGWKRSRSYLASIFACVRAWVGNGARSAGRMWSGQWIPDQLQAGHSKPSTESGDRDRRQEPQREAKGTGREERRQTVRVRVASVEVHQQSSDGRFGGLCPDGFVYNIEVKDNHNYFADGVLVHNCHHSTAKTYVDIIEKYDPKLLLGFTATPCRKSGLGLGVLYNELVIVATMQELIDQGFLVPVRYFAPFEPDLKGVKITGGDYNEKQISMTMMQGAITADIVGKWRLLGENRKTVCFTTTVAHSIAVCDKFRAEGISAEHVDGTTDPDERKDILRRYAKGEFQILCNCAVFTEGVDIPSISCVIMARPTKSIVLYLQCVGRGMRLFDGKDDCIAAGTKILTQHGLIDIDKITLNHLVWDGISFVKHKGAICKGEQNVITYSGLTATPDHQVKTAEGWRSFGTCAAQQIPIVTTGLGRSPIRECEGYFSGNKVGGESVESKKTSTLSVRNLWQRILDRPVQPSSRDDQGVQSLQSTCSFSGLALRAVEWCSAKMYESQIYPLCRLWWAWNQIQFPVSIRRVHMDKGQHWGSGAIEGNTPRPDRQRRELRGWEFKVVHPFAKCFAHSEEAAGPASTPVQGAVSRNQVCGQYSERVDRVGYDVRPDYCEVEYPVLQTKREVWDILDCGPLHRFTANGLLVHNCILIDMAGVYWEHGPITEITNWTLSETTKAVSEKNEERKERNSRPITCLSCSHVYTGQLKCPHCGTIPVKERYGQDVEEIDAVLGEIIYKDGIGKKTKKSKEQPATMEQKQSFYSQLITHCRNKGWKEGAAAQMYREKFSVWPNKLNKNPEPIRDGVANWIKSRNIARVKSKESQQHLAGLPL